MGRRRWIDRVAQTAPVMIALWAAIGCTEPVADPQTAPIVVEVASQRCDRPMVHRGNGTRLGDGYVLTAAHLVDGELRDLRIDGDPAVRVAVDERLDLAVLRLADRSTPERADPSPSIAAGVVSGAVEIMTVAGAIETEIRREITLRVDHLGQRTVHERPALELAGAVEQGTSGSPVIGADGGILGVVVLSDPANDVSYAVRVDAQTVEGLRSAKTGARIGCPAR